jgi:hypothetical protein
MHVNFNFQVDATGNPRPEQQFAIAQLVEHRLGSLDFAIIQLVGNPEQVYGTSAIAIADPELQDPICIVGHPAGERKRIEAGPVSNLVGTQIRYNDIDTLGGNSGSGVLRSPGGTIVGVHTNGGCTTTGGFNFGVRISNLLNASPTLQGLPGGIHWDHIGHANDVVAMAAINNKLFAATSDNRLWWRDPVGTNVNWDHIGHANDVVAMAAINNKLFAATSDNRLWWRDPLS